jgi:gamma-glutamyl phosphate reductase
MLLTVQPKKQDDGFLAAGVALQAENARSGGRQLCALTGADRANILRAVAAAIALKSDEIAAANTLDMEAAARTNVSFLLYCSKELHINAPTV